MNKIIERIIECLATFFYVGKIPKAPGTFGTLAAIPLWFVMTKLNPIFYMALTVLILILGIFISEAYERTLKTHDSKTIVIDEVAGFLITMVWLPVTWQSVVLGFLLFRFFDILKPGPIKLIDQKVKGGVGVMLDDVAAGIIASLILQIVYNQTLWLGAQTQTL
jgi:phosphatidylglycerophosphatase A